MPLTKITPHGELWLEIAPGLAVPQRFSYRETPANGPTATVHVRVDEDGIHCDRLEIEPRSPTEPLTAQRMRDVPLGQLMQRAPVAATRPVTFDPSHDDRNLFGEIRVRRLPGADANATTHIVYAEAWLLNDPVTSLKGQLADTWEAMSEGELADAVAALQEQTRLKPLTDAERAATETAIRPRRRPRQSLSDEEIRAVAQDYKSFKALGQRDPTIQVAHKHYASRSTASRWIRRARELGYLDPPSKEI